jgi:hypothetical protein
MDTVGPLEQWLGKLSICMKHKPKPPMCVNFHQTAPWRPCNTVGVQMQPVNAHMFCRSVNADFDVYVPTFTPFTNIPSLYTARRSPQMGTWWWSSQTKLGMRMPGITLVNAPWHQAHVRVKPHEIPWFSACVISCPWPPGFCQADVCCQGNCSGRVPVPKPGKLAAAKRLFMKIRRENHVPCF